MFLCLSPSTGFVEALVSNLGQSGSLLENHCGKVENEYSCMCNRCGDYSDDF